MVLGGVRTLARFSEVFPVLRKAIVGLSAPWVPPVLVTMNVVYAPSTYPAGLPADRSRRTLLALGLRALIAADLVLALARSAVVIFVGVPLGDLNLAGDCSRRWLPPPRPPISGGTAFGVFNLARVSSCR